MQQPLPDMPHSLSALVGKGWGQDTPVNDIEHPLGCHAAILEVGDVWPGLPKAAAANDGSQEDGDDLPPCVLPRCHPSAAVPQGLSTPAAGQMTSNFPRCSWTCECCATARLAQMAAGTMGRACMVQTGLYGQQGEG